MLSKLYSLISLLFLVQSIFAEPADSVSKFRKKFPVSALSIQFAGSTGFLTAGYYVGTASEKILYGMQYGYTPKSLGGTIHSLSLKLLYNPFNIKLNENVSLQPLQTGIFLVQNFGKDIPLTWDNRYPDSYYWWLPSQRLHLYVSSALSVSGKKEQRFDKATIYLEANTNDLYISSFAGNMSTISLLDILFLGIGVRISY